MYKTFNTEKKNEQIQCKKFSYFWTISKKKGLLENVKKDFSPRTAKIKRV